MSSNNKMKGLFRNIRLMFETEKEPEIQIGLPTDVKHVAHIGWDGPSVNSPSWMNEFKSPNGFATAPLASPGDAGQKNEAIQWSSEDKGRSNRNREQKPEARQSARRNMSAGSDSPSREKTTRTRRSSKKDDPDRARRQKETTSSQQDGGGGGGGRQDIPDLPKTNTTTSSTGRRKKSKDTSKSSRSRTKSQDTAPSSESGSVRSQASTATERRHNSARDSLEELEEAIS